MREPWQYRDAKAASSRQLDATMTGMPARPRARRTFRPPKSTAGGRSLLKRLACGSLADLMKRDYGSRCDPRIALRVPIGARVVRSDSAGSMPASIGRVKVRARISRTTGRKTEGMAKILYACSRRTPFGSGEQAILAGICKALTPDNLASSTPHRVLVEGKIAFGIVNDRGSIVIGSGVLLGCLYGDDVRWDEPEAQYPDGSYALFRSSSNRVEVVSDAAASKTIWYFLDEERFVASTSQRAIVMFLGRYEFNDRVIPWMLSTGSLGPEESWDRRIRRLPPDSSVVLDRRQWSISLKRRPIRFSMQSRPRSRHRDLLTNDIRAVIRSLKHSRQVRFAECFLPLSGGYDSRAILCFLADEGVPQNLKAITWGLGRNVERKGNDASVASEVARKVGVAHRYFGTDAAAEAMDRAIDRFIRCGEGRIDHFSAYTDGLETWRRLVEEEGCSGIIRGDEGMGWIPVSSELTVRLNVGMGLCADYRNLQGLIERFGLPRQELPAELGRGRDETLSAWRDRLYHAYRLPTILAALSDIKYSYLEILNPLLARRVLHRVRELPDPLRTDKALFKEIVNSISPEVPYAQEAANEDLVRLLGRKEIAVLVQSALRSERARRVFSTDFLEHILHCARHTDSTDRPAAASTWRRLKGIVPRPVKNWVRDRVAKPTLDANVVAFRVFLILRMHELLNSDAAQPAAVHPSDASLSPPKIASLG